MIYIVNTDGCFKKIDGIKIKVKSKAGDSKMIKKFTAVVLMLTLSASVLIAGCAKQKANQLETIDSENTSASDVQQVEKSESESTDSAESSTKTKGLNVVSDKNGLRFINEITGEETPFYKERSDAYVYDDKTVYFVKMVEDKTVKIRHDDPDDPAEGETWSRCDVYKYTIDNKQLEKVFTTNGTIGVILLNFDSENLYYVDVADKNVGYYNGINSGTNSLFKYNFRSGKKELISEKGQNLFLYDNYIFYTDCDNPGYEDGPQVFPGNVHIYDTKSGKDIIADDYGDLLYYENDRLYFIHITEKDNVITGGVVKSCKADGTDIKTGISISGEILTVMKNYVGIRVGQWDGPDDWIEEVVNVKTGNRFKTEAYSYIINDDVLLDSSYLYSNHDEESDTYYFDKKIYQIKDDGTRELFLDLSSIKGVNALDKFKYKTDYGIYVSNSGEAQEYDKYVITSRCRKKS